MYSSEILIEICPTSLSLLHIRTLNSPEIAANPPSPFSYTEVFGQHPIENLRYLPARVYAGELK